MRLVPILGVLLLLGSSMLWMGLVAHSQFAGLFRFQSLRARLRGLIRFFSSARTQRRP